MVALSKPTLLDYTCYELGHCWTPSCTKASFDVFKCVSKEALQIYGSLYLIAGLARGKGKNYFRKKFWGELAQSTLFLGTNGTLFITCFCVWRKIGVFYNTNTLAYMPCLVAAYVAINLERKSRRGQLAMYILNLALETVWRMMKARGWVKSLPNGEVLLFSVASAIYLYYFRKKDGLSGSTMSVFKKLFGSAEVREEETEAEVADDTFTQETQRTNRPTRAYLPTSIHNMVAPVVRWLQGLPSHSLCRHKHSCPFYTIQGSLKMFGVGYGIQAVIKLLSSLSRALKQPSTVISALVNSGNVQLGAFLATLVGLFRGMSCLLRWLRDKDDDLHGLVAGFVAGWSMMFYKSNTIALYTAIKLAETLYFKGIAVGKLPYVKCADIIIYSVSCALVFHAAVLEPHNLRPAYWRFLLRVTGNRFAQMNRRILDPFVPNCSKLYPDYWPDYDMRYTNLVKPAS